MKKDPFAWAQTKNTCKKCGASSAGLWLEAGLCFECRRKINNARCG